MTKHQEAFASLITTLPKYLFVAFVLVSTPLYSADRAHAIADVDSCAVASRSEIDAVFNQAVSTVSNLANAAVKAQAKGTWRPNGSFRKVFFLQSGRALRSIRALLESSTQQGLKCVVSQSNTCTSKQLPKAGLLEAFDQIFSVSFPKGLRSLRRLQKIERNKFASALDALPDNYITCG
jgi:hypothetical protein